MSENRFPQTLILLSGLPGSGKSTMARRLVDALRFPLLAIDDVVDALPSDVTIGNARYWETMVHILLHLVDSQLAWGNSVLVDSVFMGLDAAQTHHSWSDRRRAYEIAQQRQVQFRPIYFYLSDEHVWQARLAARAAALKDERVATWTQVATQRHYFEPWQAEEALFIDSVNGVAENFEKIMAYIM